jgi:hypothetical protein
MRYPFYSQNDPKWANVRFSVSRLRMGDYGCLITTLASMATWMGVKMTPNEVAGKCQYTADGLLYWNSVPAPLKFKRRYFNQYDKSLAKHTLLNTKWDVVLLEVQWGRQKHWVGLVGWGRNGEVIHNPWDGKKKALSKCPFSGVTGMAILTKI